MAQTRGMRTVGVEEELLLVSLEDGRAQSVQGQLVLSTGTAAPGEVAGGLEGEFQEQQVETRTAPVQDMADLEREVRTWRAEAAAAARATESAIAALASSPLPVGPAPVAGERFSWIRERYQLIAEQQLNCGLHVHVSVESAEEGIGVLDRIRVWLPVLLALSSNSPFVQGGETGFSSWRTQMMGRWPSSGPTDVFGTPEAYRQRVAQMVDTTVLLDEGMVYFDARLSQNFPTVEIRVADACSRVEDAVLVAALSRALVESAAREWADGAPAPDVPTALLRLASFQASRHGLAADLLDPVTLRPAPAGDVVASLVDWVRPALETAGDVDRVEAALQQLRDEGTGADLQRATFERTGQLVDVVAQAVRLTGSAGTR